MGYGVPAQVIWNIAVSLFLVKFKWAIECVTYLGSFLSDNSFPRYGGRVDGLILEEEGDLVNSGNQAHDA